MTVRRQWLVAFIAALFVIVIALLLSPTPTPARVTIQSCEQAREVGATLPLTPADPGWNPALDPDKDGVAC